MNEAKPRRARRAHPPLLPSKEISSLLLVLAAASAAAQEPAPRVVLERTEGARRSAWVVRGLLRSDLVLTLERVGAEASLHTISLAGRPPLGFSSATPGGRVTATSPASTFRYFDVDLSRKTVRCNLSRLADESSPDLLDAAREYGLLRQGFEAAGAYAPEESPVLALLAVLRQTPHPSPPFRKSVPLADGEPGAAELAEAAVAALGR